MSWYDDHLNAVADRFAKRYAKGQNKARFIQSSGKEMQRLGWPEPDIDRMLKRIERKIEKEASA